MEIMNIIMWLCSFLAGLVGAYFGNYAKWTFEKKRLLYQERKALISDVRQLLNSEIYDNSAFRQSDTYLRVRPYLSEETINLIESTGFDYSEGRNKFHVLLTKDGVKMNYFRKNILNDILVLERNWKLI